MTVHNLATERELTWRFIDLWTGVEDNARQLFHNSADFKRYWPDLRNYVRQARLYDDASAGLPGASGSLLLYYAALQLAKAELLLKRPEAIFNQEVGHGLTFRPEAAASIRGDSLRVRDGVFRELYRVRTGRSIAIGERLPVPRLLRACPDIGFEVEAAGYGSLALTSIRHHVLSDSTASWSVLSFANPLPIVTCAATSGYLARGFDLVAAIPSGLPNAFEGPVLQARRRVGLQEGDSDFREAERDVVSCRAHEGLRALLGQPIYGEWNLSSSLYRTRFLPMPADLVRYCLVYYVSSLVRYKPSRLDPGTGGLGRWLLDAMAEEARLHLLRSALTGICGLTYQLERRGG